MPMYVYKMSTMFNIQRELAKLSISIPSNELLRNQEYRNTITKMISNQGETHPDMLELTNDNPTIILGSNIDSVDSEDEEVPPFYMILNVHDMVLHNAMLDSGASHNLILKGVVEIPGLEITRPSKYLYSFDSHRVKCLGLIKNMVMYLNNLVSKTVVMDVVVADIPPKFSILLSRY